MLRSSLLLIAIASLTSVRGTTSLTDLCTAANIQHALPSEGSLTNITVKASTLTVAVANTSTSAPGGGDIARRQLSSSSNSSSTTYCNVTLAYSHTGLNDTVNVKLAFPDPSSFESRWYVGGGGGFSLNSDATGGLSYGAASGSTDGGYDGFNYSYDEQVLVSNGTIDWEATNMFGYQALGELTQLGKSVTKQLYNVTTLKSYFSGCSDGGREAMSQAQRFASEYDGIVAGAPAFRFAQQQVLHLLPGVVETVQGHAPEPCALQAIVNATIAGCDGLDGIRDGVVARTDLCKLRFNLTSIIGTAYNCSSSQSSSAGGAPSGGGPKDGTVNTTSASISSTTSSISAESLISTSASVDTTGTSSVIATSQQTAPAQSGTVTAEDVAVAQDIYNGLFNSKGQQAYLAWQYTASLSDAETTYNSTTETYTVTVNSMGGEYVRKFIQLVDEDNLSTLSNVTYDTLVEWMSVGMTRYNASLQTTYDLSAFKSGGGKLLHYHGESDPSIPAGSSVHYRQSISTLMNETDADLDEWYQLYLIPGAGHCGANSLQSSGPYPEASSLMGQIIEWVESGITPTGLDATANNTTQSLCRWPTRPTYTNATSTVSNTTNEAAFTCVEQDAESLASWTYFFDAAYDGEPVY